jgi:hypothetical protein
MDGVNKGINMKTETKNSLKEMHVGKMIFVLVDRAPCSVFLRVHLLA